MKTIAKIEPNLGEVFEYMGVKAECVRGDAFGFRKCIKCAFRGSKKCDTLRCSRYEREDDRDVHFIKLQQP
ncbi:hypothetical protein BT681P2_00016 [Bacteroides phage BT681P2]|nr:hypothetical protein BT681P2_00016 [Bacteroides phage BT681P2]